MGQIFANFGQIREIKSSRKILRELIRENKSTRKILKDPIREKKSTRNVKNSLAKIKPRENISP